MLPIILFLTKQQKCQRMLYTALCNSYPILSLSFNQIAWDTGQGHKAKEASLTIAVCRMMGVPPMVHCLADPRCREGVMVF